MADDGGNNNQIDAGPQADTSLPDMSPSTPVTVTVTRNGSGVANVKVHFQNPDSTLVATVMTDSNGVASAVMPNGGFVTAVDPFRSNPSGAGNFVDLRTFAGVKPGDELVLDDADLTSQSVTLTGPIDAGGTVTQYMFSTPCDRTIVDSPGSASTPTAELDLDARCLPTSDYLIASLDANHEVVNWLFAPNVTIAGTAHDFSGSALNNIPVTKSYAFNNVPEFVDGALFGQTLRSSKGVMYDTVDVLAPSQGAITTSLGLPAFTNAFDLTFALMPGENVFSIHGVADWSPFNATYSTDVGARLVTEIATEPAFNASNRQVTWTVSATGQTPDFVIADIDAFRNNLEINWTIAAPHAASTLQLPTLPDTDYNPTSTDTVIVEGLALVKITGGYDAVREVVFASGGPLELGVTGTGSMTVTQYEYEPPVRKLGKLGKLDRSQAGSVVSSRLRWRH